MAVATRGIKTLAEELSLGKTHPPLRGLASFLVDDDLSQPGAQLLSALQQIGTEFICAGHMGTAGKGAAFDMTLGKIWQLRGVLPNSTQARTLLQEGVQGRRDAHPIVHTAGSTRRGGVASAALTGLALLGNGFEKGRQRKGRVGGELEVLDAELVHLLLHGILAGA